MNLKDKEFKKLYGIANQISDRSVISNVTKYGQVGCALITDNGNIYTGISIKAPSGLGNCAEYTAVANMLMAKETNIKKIISVRNGEIIPPCGRCRELIAQVVGEDMNVQIMVEEDIVLLLKDLLPYAWDYKKGKDNL